jgi:hypothetical protein
MDAQGSSNEASDKQFDQTFKEFMEKPTTLPIDLVITLTNLRMSKMHNVALTLCAASEDCAVSPDIAFSGAFQTKEVPWYVATDDDSPQQTSLSLASLILRSFDGFALGELRFKLIDARFYERDDLICRQELMFSPEHCKTYQGIEFNRVDAAEGFTQQLTSKIDDVVSRIAASSSVGSQPVCDPCVFRDVPIPLPTILDAIVKFSQSHCHNLGTGSFAEIGE